MPTKDHLSRRQFAGLAIAGGAAGPLIAQQAATPANTVPQNTAAPRRPTVEPEQEAFGQTIEFSRNPQAGKVEAFAMTDVRLLPGRMRGAQEANLAYLQRLPAERLVYNFRANAGIPTSGQPFGGWEKPDCELRGHFTGHYLSA